MLFFVCLSYLEWVVFSFSPIFRPNSLWAFWMFGKVFDCIDRLLWRKSHIQIICFRDMWFNVNFAVYTKGWESVDNGSSALCGFDCEKMYGVKNKDYCWNYASCLSWNIYFTYLKFITWTERSLINTLLLLFEHDTLVTRQRKHANHDDLDELITLEFNMGQISLRRVRLVWVRWAFSWRIVLELQ